MNILPTKTWPKHDWRYGTCERCGFSELLAGVDREDAPPCTTYVDTITTAERIVDAVGEALGIDTAGNVVETGQFTTALQAVQQILDEEE